jgi:hypothetical protein
MKEGIFVGPPIKQLLEDDDFSKKKKITLHKEQPRRHFRRSAETF